MEKRYYWLKLQSDFFGSLRIKKLRKMKRGDTLLVIYLKMQLSTLCKDGVFEFKGIEEDVASELALDLGEKVADVRACLSYLFENGLCEKVDETHYCLPWVSANTGSETAATMRWRDWKERKNDGSLESNKTPTNYQQTANVEIEKEKEIESEIDKRKRFTPPSVEEVRAYCQERKNNVDPQTFVDFYESKGWLIGKTKMKDWKAAVRTWEKNRVDRGRGRQNPALKYQQTPISETDWNNMVENFEEDAE